MSQTIYEDDTQHLTYINIDIDQRTKEARQWKQRTLLRGRIRFQSRRCKVPVMASEIDSVELERRFPEAYDRGRRAKIRYYQSVDSGLVQDFMNPYALPQYRADRCEWVAFNAGWFDTKI